MRVTTVAAAPSGAAQTSTGLSEVRPAEFMVVGKADQFSLLEVGGSLRVVGMIRPEKLGARPRG